MFLTTTLAAKFAPYRLAAEILAVVAAFGLGYLKGGDAKFNELSADWSAQQMRQAQDYAERLAESHKQRDQQQAEYQAKEATHAIQLEDSRRRELALRSSLRDRPERPAAVSAAASGAEAPSCGTGAGLHRQDAEFLVGEAARANELRAALERCQGGNIATDGGRLDH